MYIAGQLCRCRYVYSLWRFKVNANFLTDDHIKLKKTHRCCNVRIYHMLETTTFQVEGMLRLNGQRLDWMKQCDCDGECKVFLAHSGRFDMTVHTHTHANLDCNSRISICLYSGGWVMIAIQESAVLSLKVWLHWSEGFCQIGAGGRALQINFTKHAK